MTNKAMCNKGTIARKIEFNTTCKPENECKTNINRISSLSYNVLKH